MIKREMKWARNKKQYNEFRKSFKKWWAKYRPDTDKAVVNTESATLYKGKEFVATYFAPDYVKYMKFTLRKYL